MEPQVVGLSPQRHPENLSAVSAGSRDSCSLIHVYIDIPSIRDNIIFWTDYQSLHSSGYCVRSPAWCQQLLRVSCTCPYYINHSWNMSQRFGVETSFLGEIFFPTELGNKTHSFLAIYLGYVFLSSAFAMWLWSRAVASTADCPACKIGWLKMSVPILETYRLIT